MKEYMTLILDDDPDVRSALAAMIRRAGFAAELAATPPEFYELYAGRKPALVVLDVVLGKHDVCEVLDFIARSGHPPPVILMSGYDYRILHAMARLAKDRGLRVLDVVEKRSDAGARLAALLKAHAVGPLPARAREQPAA